MDMLKRSHDGCMEDCYIILLCRIMGSLFCRLWPLVLTTREGIWFWFMTYGFRFLEWSIITMSSEYSYMHTLLFLGVQNASFYPLDKQPLLENIPLDGKHP